jgi:primosomal protein N' (replication factor Y)
MPEIALTGNSSTASRARFGVRPAGMAFRIDAAHPRPHLARDRRRRGAVVVGARSALFLPYADLGLIVVDEEHDPAYKQEDGVHYHARDMAVVRAHIAKIPVVLASATPSLETEVNARAAAISAWSLPERFGGQRLPRSRRSICGVKPPPRGRFISPVLAEAVRKTRSSAASRRCCSSIAAATRR